MSRKWAKRSAPPASCAMKPKPLLSLNHFTVPVWVVIKNILSTIEMKCAATCGACSDTQEPIRGISGGHREDRGGRTRITNNHCLAYNCAANVADLRPKRRRGDSCETTS